MGVRLLSAKAVFLDRDGVINRAVVRNRKPYPPNTLQDLEILPDVPEALNLLKESGFLLIVVTNQPDVGRGTQKQENVEEMHTYLVNKDWMANVSAGNHCQRCCFRRQINMELILERVL